MSCPAFFRRSVAPRLLFAGLLFASAIPGRAAEAPESAPARAHRLVESAGFQRLVAVFERDHERFVRELIQLTEIPSPPFGEKARGEAFAGLLRAAGLERVETDQVGNVLALRRGRARAPLLVVAAHLDTVFPAGTDVTVKRAGTTLRAPGVDDDTRGLAVLLAFVRALHETNLQTPGDILFVGNVGEEGLGDLRGTRYLFGESKWRQRIARYITIDGGNLDLVGSTGLGSRRYRVTFKGPGGHSWGGFGTVNPAFAMADAITRLGRVKVPKSPRASLNVGVLSGGTSVNSIPSETSMEIDLRAVAPAVLKDLDEQLHAIVAAAVAAENSARATTNGSITADVVLVGDRPSGTLAPDSPVLQQLAATMKLYDRVPVWEAMSSDANIPISLGIPGFSIGRRSGSRGGRNHSLDEWTDVEKTQAVKDFEVLAAVILTVAEVP